MKKFFAVMLSSVLALSLVLGAAACKKEDPKPDDPTPPVDDQPVSIAITGSRSIELGAGKTKTLTARVSHAKNTGVTWEVIEGGDVLTLAPQEDTTKCDVSAPASASATLEPYVVRATSVEDNTKYAEVSITVLERTTLTDDMLSELASYDTIGFSGSMDIELWTFGTYGHLEDTRSVNVETKMDGEYWYSTYQDSSTGLERTMYVKNHDGIVSEVLLSLHNDEEYYPMTDRNGDNIPWNEGGYYNNFKDLKAADFTFNEDTYLWEYVPKSADDNLIQRMVSSANPYEFKAKNLSLMIMGNTIFGITSQSEDDASIAANYNAKMTLTSTIETQEVEVPHIEKLGRKNFHDDLKTALDNFKKHTSYKLSYYNYSYSAYMQSETESEYVETVTEDLVLFEEKMTAGTVNYTSVSGYKNMGGNLYNAFYQNYTYTRDEKGNVTQVAPAGYEATQAFAGNFSDCKPGFDFSEEIFTFTQPADEGVTDYYVDPTLTRVASEFYKGILTDDSLYGIFATALSTTSGTILPYLSVKDGEIVAAGFGYDMGLLMQGIVTIEYSDFDTAEITEEIDFVQREIPLSWTDSRYVRHIAESTAEDRDPIVEVFTERLGAEVVGENAANIPFFPEVLGDTYGFAAEDVYRPQAEGGGYSPRMYEALGLYFDVELDMDYTITSSMDKLARFLESNGFTMTAEYEYRKGRLGIAIADNDLDLYVYLWDYGVEDEETHPAV